MRMLSGEESPDSGARTLGHQVILEYFAQDEATRLDPALTVYETLETGSPNDMVPAIRNILGGFLFSGDDIYKKAGVLSGGERTRLAVARMLLRPSNTLLLDEPTNHLDLDSKDVLLEALEDYGGTLIIVSHDRYFVEKLATKIIEIGHGEAVVYPGTYTEFLWHKDKGQGEGAREQGRGREESGSRKQEESSQRSQRETVKTRAATPKPKAQTPPLATQAREDRKREETERRKQQKAVDALRKRIADLEGRIAEREGEIKELERAMSVPGFYDDRGASKQTIDRHQSLMWEVGDLMAQWEALQEHASTSES
jgi:ATP-binding cassette subfamily F protein 3